MFLNIGKGWTNGPWLVLKECPETSVTICWTTAVKKESTLVWGESKNRLVEKIISPASKFHSATLRNLTPGLVYFYSISEGFPLFTNSKVFSFRTQKGRTKEEELVFTVIGDLQPKNRSTLETNYTMARQIESENPQFIVQTGDLVQIGSLPRYWNYLMKSLPLMASSRPVLPAVGNHEYYLFHNNRNFRSYFPYAFDRDKSGYYSRDIGSLHLVFLDPYDGGPAGMSSRMSREQKEWIISDLEGAIQKGSEWIFVILHQSVLSNGEYPGDRKLQKSIIPVLSKFDVDAVFWGHAHLYEHWQYQYGKNGYLFNSGDLPGKSPIDFFCIGSSGASLESNYKLFSHKPFKHSRPGWFSIKTGGYIKKRSVQYPWNRNIFLKGPGVRHYYHFPFNKDGKYSDDPEISFNTENKWFGYRYGENTLHYAKVRIKDSICTITIHYPDGTVLGGPDGSIPQKFHLRKKKR